MFEQEFQDIHDLDTFVNNNFMTRRNSLTMTS